MTSVDLILLGILFLSALVGFVRGLVREVLSIAAWVGAAAVAIAFLPAVRPLLSGWMPSPEWVDPTGYIVLFIVSLIVFSLIARAIGNVVRTSAISGVDRTLGLVFGLARGAVLAIAAYIVAGMAVPVDHWPEQVLESQSLPYIYVGAEWAVRRIPPEYQPPVYKPPPSRQTALEGILNASPTGRAIDPPIRR
jgi:membrane protein required for colicin V production